MARQKEVSTKEFQERLAHCRAFVLYSPLRTEASYKEIVTLPFDAVTFHVAPRPSLNPTEEAQRALRAIGSLPAAVFMPGRRFDRSGTRIGQGGGWYDRFLARVPDEWVRIGFCTKEQFSDEPLQRNEWDQPVDYVCVVGGAVYKTHARPGIV